MRHMNTTCLFWVRLLLVALPETRLFSLKAKLLRLAGARLGDNVRICSSVHILGGGRLSIGDDTWVGHQALISTSSQVMIGSAVDIGPRVYIGTGTHEIDVEGARSAGTGINRDVIIADGAWLGVGCIVLPGVSVGEKAVIAAGAVVTKDVPARTLVAGVPAKVVRSL